MIDWTKLVEERNVWVNHNFPNRHIPDPGESLMGMVEELGELTHAMLKKAQSIRGEAVEHEADARDAVGDLTVYMLGVMAFSGWPSGTVADPHHALDHGTTMTMATCVGAMCYLYEQQLSRIRYGEYIDRMIYNMRQFCKTQGWDYDSIVLETWAAVKKRDWIKYPGDGVLR